MKPKYSRRTVDEAVQLLDVYASQARDMWFSLPALRHQLSLRPAACQLAIASRGWWPWATFDGRRCAALEAAQRLREGWRP